MVQPGNFMSLTEELQNYDQQAALMDTTLPDSEDNENKPQPGLNDWTIFFQVFFTQFVFRIE